MDLSESVQEPPLLVMLDESRFEFGGAQFDGADIRFVMADGTVLPHEIETWTSEQAVVWIKPPVVRPDGEEVALYFGNPEAPPLGREEEVWSNGYRAVWHMDPALQDSASGGNDCLGLSTTVGDGVFGRAIEFSDGIVLCDDSELDGLLTTGGTISAWVLPPLVPPTPAGRIVDKSSNTTPGGYNVALRNDVSIQFARGHDSLGLWATPPGSIALADWTWVFVTFADDGDGAAPVFYFDGVLQTTTVISNPTGQPDNEEGLPVAIGNISGTQDRIFGGVIDEVRLSDELRDETWVILQNVSMQDQLISFGRVETR